MQGLGFNKNGWPVNLAKIFDYESSASTIEGITNSPAVEVL
jgi:hypothetical protein